MRFYTLLATTILILKIGYSSVLSININDLKKFKIPDSLRIFVHVDTTLTKSLKTQFRQNTLFHECTMNSKHLDAIEKDIYKFISKKENIKIWIPNAYLDSFFFHSYRQFITFVDYLDSSLLVTYTYYNEMNSGPPITNQKENMRKLLNRTVSTIYSPYWDQIFIVYSLKKQKVTKYIDFRSKGIKLKPVPVYYNKLYSANKGFWKEPEELSLSHFDSMLKEYFNAPYQENSGYEIAPCTFDSIAVSGDSVIHVLCVVPTFPAEFINSPYREKYRKYLINNYFNLFSDTGYYYYNDYRLNLLLYAYYRKDAKSLNKYWDGPWGWRLHMKREDIEYWYKIYEAER